MNCSLNVSNNQRWHAGHWQTNLRSVGIEVVSGGSDFSEAQICTLASLVAELRGRYGISADDVIRHYDVTGKLCPAPYVDAGKWAALHARICGDSSGASAGSGGSGGSSGVSGDVGELARRRHQRRLRQRRGAQATAGFQLLGGAEARERDALLGIGRRLWLPAFSRFGRVLRPGGWCAGNQTPNEMI